MPASVFNGSRPTKHRRSKADIEIIKEVIYEIVDNNRPMTVRQVFYQLVNIAVIGKRETQYKSTVVRLLGEMRRNGELPFEWLADSTRWMRKPFSYSSMQAALKRTAELYRRSLWDNQDVYVEIWLEKDALAGVLYRVTSSWDVPLMVTRGYPSLSFPHQAAAYINGLEKPTYLYYFGDYDPLGLDITRNVREDIEEFAPWAEVHFERVAVSEDQIEAWQLPTRPTKVSDSRSGSFWGESVEVDAIPPDVLRTLVSEKIIQHIDEQALHVMQVAEESERSLLTKIAADLNGVPE